MSEPPSGWLMKIERPLYTSEPTPLRTSPSNVTSGTFASGQRESTQP